MAYIDLGNVKGEKGDRGLQGKGTAFFGKCDTNSDISTKDIKLIEESIVEPYDGLVIFVKFTHENNSSILSLTIDGETTFDVDTDETVSWKAGDSVLFAFAESKWHYLEGTGTPFNTKTGVVDTKTLNVGEQENYHTEVITDSSNDTKTGGLNGTITGNRLILKSKTGEDIEQLPNFDGTTAETRLDEFGGIETNGYVSTPLLNISKKAEIVQLNSAAIKSETGNIKNISTERITANTAGIKEKLSTEALEVKGASTFYGNVTAVSSLAKKGSEVLVPTTLFNGLATTSVTLTDSVENYKFIDIVTYDPYRSPTVGIETCGMLTTRIDCQYSGITHSVMFTKTYGASNTVQIYCMQIRAIGNVVAHTYLRTDQGENIGVLIAHANRNGGYAPFISANIGGIPCMGIAKVIGWR